MAPLKSHLTDHDRVVATHENVNFIKEKIEDIHGILKDHEKRIDKIESWTDKASVILRIVGLSSIIGGVSAAGAKIGGII